MRTVYYYDVEGNFNSAVVEDRDSLLLISEITSKIVSAREPIMCEMFTLPITKYQTRYGDTIWIATRNDFEAKCLIKNHLDLDIHFETSYPTYVYEEHHNNIKDDLLNRLVHQTKHKFRFSLQVREVYGRVEITASL